MTTDFTSRLEHYRTLMSLGIPIVIGQVGNIILGFADTLMVGHHSMQELAAASFVNNMFMLFVVFALGFSYSLTPVIGYHYGRGESRLIGPALRDGLAANSLLALCLLVILAAFYASIGFMGQPEELLPLMRPYLLLNIISMPFICWGNAFRQFFDAIGDTKVSMCVLLGGNLLNILGNYVLIYGKWGMPELGLVGAGVSTLLARVVLAIIFAIFFFQSGKYRSYSHHFFSNGFSRQGFKRINALGWPMGVQMGMETAAFSLTALLVGWIGTTALAAHQVMITISQLFYMVYYGMASAVAIRVSHFYGQHDMRSVRLSATSGFHLILLVAILVSLPVFLFRDVISYWFTDSVEVCNLVSHTVALLILYQFGDGLQCTYANALRGVSRVKPLVPIAFIAYFVISLPLSWLLGIHLQLGLPGIWASFPISLLCAGILYYAEFTRFLRRESC